MKILVTGGAGFIASHVSDRLLALGHDVVDRGQPVHGQAGEPPRRRRRSTRSTSATRLWTRCSPPSSRRWSFHHAAHADVTRSVREPELRRLGQHPGLAQPARVLPRTRRREVRLRQHRRRPVRRALLHPGRRGPPHRSRLALRGEQARGGAVPLRLPREPRPRLHRAPLSQRLRTPAGSPRRGRGGGHLRPAAADRAAAGHLRRRQQDPRLLLRGRHRRGEHPRP